MKFLWLVWSSLWRSRARTWMTFLSIMVAFLLFGLLQALHSTFTAGVRLAGDDHLIVTHRQGLNKPLAFAQYGKLQGLPGVRAVQLVSWFGGYYQDPKNQIATFGVDPNTAVTVDSRLSIAPEALKSFQEIRTGALIGRDLAASLGWKVGQHVTLMSPLQRKDGGSAWEFDIVGLWEYDPKLTGGYLPSNYMVMRYDYMDESVAYPGYVAWYVVRVNDPRQLATIAKDIDRQFLNSEFETRTQTEAQFQSGFLKQLGDVGLIVSTILLAVFFTMLLVVGNSMMQAFRERVTELAVMKTIGFSDRRIAVLVGAESLLLCVSAALAGLALAFGVVPVIRATLAQFFSALHIEAATVVVAIWLAVLVAILAALIPVLRTARLTVVEALAEGRTS